MSGAGRGERISESALAELRRRHPIAGLIGRRMKLLKAGSEFKAPCPFHAEKSPSFFVVPKKAMFHCFGCGAHGDIISFLMRADGLPFREAVDKLAGESGTKLDTVGAFEERIRSASEEYADANGRRWEPDADERARLEQARAMWRNTEPAGGTLVDRYLRRRAIPGRIPPTIRFAPRLWHSDSRSEGPALVAALQDSLGKVAAVQRIWLDPVAGAKASLRPAKKTKGAMRDGAVRLGRAGNLLGIAEGVETALSAMRIFSVPVWACLGAQRMGAVAIPERVERVILFADNGDVGRREAEKAADKYLGQGLMVAVEYPPEEHTDFNDWAQASAGSRVAA